jgi:hypothetical protein
MMLGWMGWDGMDGMVLKGLQTNHNINAEHRTPYNKQHISTQHQTRNYNHNTTTIGTQNRNNTDYLPTTKQQSQLRFWSGNTKTIPVQR